MGGASHSARTACARKIALLNEVRKAMGEVMAIHNDEVSALLTEDFGRLADLDATLQAARDYKVSLIELYREHV